MKSFKSPSIFLLIGLIIFILLNYKFISTKNTATINYHPHNNITISSNNDIKKDTKSNLSNEKNSSIQTNKKTKYKHKINKSTPLKKQTIFKIGSKGVEIKNIQIKLNKFGYKLNTDGIFGKSTKIAVCDFQRRNKLESDGIVGYSTINKLNMSPTKDTMYNSKSNIYKSKLNNSFPEKFINTRNSTSYTPYYIWVNTNSKKVYIFKKHSNHWNLYKQMICTVGKPSSPTIKGTFNIGNKGYSFIVKNNTKLMCKYYTQIHGNYLFHSVLLDRRGNIANGTLGSAISHGCIRLSITNAKFIYDNIPKGTTIYIN